MKAFVVGNGPSLLKTPLDLLEGHRSYACNRIWKIFDKTSWRPTDYVRGEPWVQNGDAVVEDLRIMAPTDAKIWLPVGFYRFIARTDVAFGRPAIPYLACNGGEHPWHLDLGDYICAHGTSVQVSMQIAVLQGATSIYLVGCDLGSPSHFYGAEGAAIDARNIVAHAFAKTSCPVPIYNCTVGGSLEMYPRMSLEDALRKEN